MLESPANQMQIVYWQVKALCCVALVSAQQPKPAPAVEPILGCQQEG